MNEKSALKCLTAIGQAIFDKKGFNIIALDVREVCSITDYFIIAEGSVDRHVKALCHTVLDALDQQNNSALRVEGQREGDWIVIDSGDLIVHLFIPEMREKYAIEEVWREGKIVDLILNTSSAKNSPPNFSSWEPI